MTEWITVPEMMPNDCEDVIVFIERDAWTRAGKYTRKREIAIGWHSKGFWHVDGCSGVTALAWMPLPKKPVIRKAVKKDG